MKIKAPIVGDRYGRKRIEPIVKRILPQNVIKVLKDPEYFKI